MRITYDAEVNAAYIYLVDGISPGQAAVQQHSIVTPNGSGEITFDYDTSGQLLGLEILHADSVLGAEVLRRAEPPSG